MLNDKNKKPEKEELATSPQKILRNHLVTQNTVHVELCYILLLKLAIQFNKISGSLF